MSMPRFLKRSLISSSESQLASKPYSSNSNTSTDNFPLWDQFDGKFVLAYTGNKQRIQNLKVEFDRIGMSDVEIFWNTDDSFGIRLFNEVFDETTYLGRPYKFQFFNNALGHYRIIKGAYSRGMQNILVMEDDIRFLRDIDKMAEIVSSLPHDYEVAMLDSHPTDELERSGHGLTGEQVNDFWRMVIHRTSAGCYALSRYGMEKMIYFYESIPLRNSDDNFKAENFNRIYYCNPCVARQVNAESDSTASSYIDWCHIYNSVGCGREKYGK